jgi:hypothetical protein
MRESNELAQCIGMFLRVIPCRGEPTVTPPHVVTQRVEPSSIDFSLHVIRLLQLHLEAAGIEFLQDASGIGVRLRRR